MWIDPLVRTVGLTRLARQVQGSCRMGCRGDRRAALRALLRARHRAAPRVARPVRLPQLPPPFLALLFLPPLRPHLPPLLPHRFCRSPPPHLLPPSPHRFLRSNLFFEICKVWERDRVKGEGKGQAKTRVKGLADLTTMTTMATLTTMTTTTSEIMRDPAS